ARNVEAHDTDSANNEIDLHACSRSLIQLFNHLFVSQPVKLGKDLRGTASLLVLNLTVDESKHLLAQVDWSNEEFAVLGLSGPASQIVEEFCCVGANLVIRREKAEVGVGARRRWI